MLLVGKILVADGTSYQEVALGGDATIDTNGALTIAANAIEGSMLNNNVISGQSEMTGDVADDDELFISDDGTLKEADFSVLRDAVFNDVSGDATIAAGGALTIATDAVQASMLNNDVISGQTELTHVEISDADEMLISDGGELKRVGVDSLRDHYFGVISGDAAIADGGALTIAANAIEGSMLNNNVISGQTEMTGDVADDDEMLISDGGELKRADFSVVRDAVFNDVSGDAAIAAGGVLTLNTVTVPKVALALQVLLLETF